MASFGSTISSLDDFLLKQGYANERDLNDPPPPQDHQETLESLEAENTRSSLGLNDRFVTQENTMTTATTRHGPEASTDDDDDHDLLLYNKNSNNYHNPLNKSYENEIPQHNVSESDHADKHDIGDAPKVHALPVVTRQSLEEEVDSDNFSKTGSTSPPLPLPAEKDKTGSLVPRQPQPSNSKPSTPSTPLSMLEPEKKKSTISVHEKILRIVDNDHCDETTVDEEEDERQQRDAPKSSHPQEQVPNIKPVPARAPPVFVQPREPQNASTNHHLTDSNRYSQSSSSAPLQASNPSEPKHQPVLKPVAAPLPIPVDSVSIAIQTDDDLLLASILAPIAPLQVAEDTNSAAPELVGLRARLLERREDPEEYRLIAAYSKRDELSDVESNADSDISDYNDVFQKIEERPPPAKVSFEKNLDQYHASSEPPPLVPRTSFASVDQKRFSAGGKGRFSHSLKMSFKNKVHPSESPKRDDVVAMPSLKQNRKRKNSRRNLGYFGLLWYDLKLWIRLQRNKRRDPVPLWRGSIKTIEGRFGVSVASFFVFTRWIFLLNFFLTLFFGVLLVIPMAIKFDYDLPNRSFAIQNIVDGKGSLGQSWLFYGGYTENAGSYNIAMAYISALVVSFLVVLVLIVRNIASVYGAVDSTFSLIKQDTTMPYSVSVFTSWDHTLANEEASSNLQLGISNFLSNQVAEDAGRNKRHVPLGEFCSLGIRRIVGWIVWLVLLVLSFLAVWYLVLLNENSTKAVLKNYSAPVCFSIINVVMPFFIRRFVRFEKYKTGRMEIRIAIARILVLRIISLYALMYAMYKRTNLTKTQTPAFTSPSTPVEQEECAGTVIGQAMYKLVILDTLVAILVRLFWTTFAVVTNTKRELDQADAVLSIVNRQALIWIGVPFCPLLPVLGMLTSSIIYLVYYKTALRICKPPSKRWNQGRSSVLFMLALLVSLLAVCVPVSIALQAYKPNCGPYGDAKFASWYDGFWEWQKERGGGFSTFVKVIFSPAFVLPTIFFLVLLAYVLSIRGKKWRHKHRETAEELKQVRKNQKTLIKYWVSSSAAVKKEAP